nr:hypothetical protein [Phenylobacterium deserti]
MWVGVGWEVFNDGAGGADAARDFHRLDEGAPPYDHFFDHEELLHHDGALLNHAEDEAVTLLTGRRRFENQVVHGPSLDVELLPLQGRFEDDRAFFDLGGDADSVCLHRLLSDVKFLFYDRYSFYWRYSRISLHSSG